MEREELNRKRREEEIRRSSYKGKTICARNEEKWGKPMKDGRKRKQRNAAKEKRAWEARLAHGGASRREERRGA